MIRRTQPPRRGVVLLAVLVVVVLLALAAYRYSDLMSAESRATASAARAVQARSIADSGVAYTLAILAANPSNPADGNLWDNPSLFQDIPVPAPPGGRPGRFSIVSVRPDGGVRHGLTDEGAKINLNGLLDLDKGVGEVGLALLLALPNMSEEVAAAIMDWLDEDEEPREGGAENDTYSGMDPPYKCKNGPFDSLDELLLVQGVTAQMLFGADRNRNGTIDADEASGGSDTLGWSAYLTVYSRGVNADSSGKQRINANNTDLNLLGEQLAELDPDLGMYILAFRLYGGKTGTDTTGETKDVEVITAKIQEDLGKGTAKPKRLKSVWDLVNTSVTVRIDSGMMAKSAVFNSPLNNPDRLKELLPSLLDKVSTSEKWDLAPRININGASEEVVTAVLGSSGLGEEQVASIMELRPDPSAGMAADALFRSMGWLLTEAKLTPKLVRGLEKFFTGQTQVYRFQVIGAFDGPGPSVRLEVVADVNNGRPRIMSYRDLTELGRGFQTKGQP